MKKSAEIIFLFFFLITPAFAQDAGEFNADDGEEFSEAAPVPAAPAVSPTKQEIFRENLVNNSPFRAARFGRTVGQRQLLELHGFVGNGNNLEVSITNPETRECRWVRVRDENARWYVESADPEKRTAVVRLDGVSLNLEMVQPNEMPLATTPVAGNAPVAIMQTQAIRMERAQPPAVPVGTNASPGNTTVSSGAVTVTGGQNAPGNPQPQQTQQRTPRSFRSGSSGANTGSSGEAVAPASASGNTGGNNPSGGGRRRNRSN